MKTGVGVNEGFRPHPEFVCRAIPFPAARRKRNGSGRGEARQNGKSAARGKGRKAARPLTETRLRGMATVELAQLLFVVDRKLNAGEIQLIRRVLQKRCDRLDAELALARESIGAATARLGRAGK